MSTTPPPGLRGQAGIRTALRVCGLLLLGAGVTLLIIGLADFFSSMGSFEGPHKFWMVFAAMPLLAVGAWCLMAGFLGSAARYSAGETMPVVKGSASYLTDGKGIFGVGRTDDDGQEGAGPFCSTCGVRNDGTARFCDSCGAALAH